MFFLLLEKHHWLCAALWCTKLDGKVVERGINHQQRERILFVCSKREVAVTSLRRDFELVEKLESN